MSALRKGAERPFHPQAPERVLHVDRLVKFEAYSDVPSLRSERVQERLHLGDLAP
jgi:hypothetical protein